MQHLPPFPILFEPFLRELKKELGYPIDIGKLMQLTAWAEAFDWHQEDQQFSRLYAMCRLLFLQDETHEDKFSGFFWQYILNELLWWKASTETQMIDPPEPVPPLADGPVLLPETPKKNIETDLPEKPDEEITEKEPPDEETTSKPLLHAKFLNLHLKGSQEGSKKKGDAQTSRFLFTDAYMPLTYREMVHGWRYLRQRDDFRPSDRLNIEATVRHIAQQGLMLNPVFEQEPINSEDLLIIFADRRGSMTPFHHLTDKLIESAIKEGGHRKAQVYFFYNCPVGYVYRKPNLTEPVSLGEVYSKIRHDRTNALVISDAGAARGTYNQLRVQRTVEFLDGAAQHEGQNIYGGLQKQALFVAWLNPMPRHRWEETTAGAIHQQSPIKMFPLIDMGKEGFLQAIHTLMGKH